MIAGAFVDFLEKGYVYKGLKPVHWCIKDRTALAEAEVEYKDHTSPSIWVRFALTSDPAKIHPDLAGRNVYGLIWTTTPWTMPANMAIAFHPKFEYVAVDVAGDVYLVAAELVKVLRRSAAGSEIPRRGQRPRDKAGARRLQAPVPGARLGRRSGGLRDTRTGHRRGPYRARPRAGGLRTGRQYGIETFCPVDAGGPVLSCGGRAGTAARGDHREDHLGGESASSSTS